jgi:hypothetical protein
VIGVLGTEATVRQPYVTNLAEKFAADAIILRHGAPDLVQAAEAILRGETPDETVFERAIAGLVDQPAAINGRCRACLHPLPAGPATASGCDQQAGVFRPWRRWHSPPDCFSNPRDKSGRKRPNALLRLALPKISKPIGPPLSAMDLKNSIRFNRGLIAKSRLAMAYLS